MPEVQPKHQKEKVYKYYGLEYTVSVTEMAAKLVNDVAPNHENLLEAKGNGV